MAKCMRAICVTGIFLLISAPLAFSAEDKKPGFHGWGDSIETSAGKSAADTPANEAKTLKAPKKAAKEAKAKQPSEKAPDRQAAKPKGKVNQKIQREREAFFEDTKKLRQEIHQKRLELRSEMAKADPSARRAKSIQKEISKRRAAFDLKRLEHFLKMKKIDPNFGRRGLGKKGEGRNCPNCPYRERGYRDGYPMMGPGYGRHHMWNDDDEFRPRHKDRGQGWSKNKSSKKSSATGEKLSRSDARLVVRDYLKSTRDLNLIIGKLSDAGDAYRAEILTRSGTLVDLVLVDKQTGHMRPAH